MQYEDKRKPSLLYESQSAVFTGIKIFQRQIIISKNK